MLFPALEETGIFTVSRLNAEIKGLLESSYPFVWVKGEISNFRVPASGHCYFTLKDEHSQIRAVLFRTQHRNLRFAPESGMEVLCQGRLSVYEPRGEYQLIVEVMEPQGVGALQLAFEQLKKKLDSEGLFDPSLKRPLPMCPQRIAVITSPTGAAIRDILKVLQRSPCRISVTLIPVRVQGREASGEIAFAIQTACALADIYKWDLIIMGRGGGSIEDLWPFNEEAVARAIVSSTIPVVSAVGHEIDITISDLAADLRAVTPTAAAEWVVSQMEWFLRELSRHLERIQQIVVQRVAEQRRKLEFLEKRLVDPKRRLQDLRLYVDDRLDRLQLAFVRRMEKLKTRQVHLAERLLLHIPDRQIRQYRTVLEERCRELLLLQRKVLDGYGFELQKCLVKLESINPLAVLSRGYSITYRGHDNRVVRTATDVSSGEEVRVRLSEGLLRCIVRDVDEDAV